MDYQFILLVVLILALIYFVTTGFNSLKLQINGVKDFIAGKLSTNMDEIKHKFDNNIGRCIKEIGDSNTNFVQQIRKLDNIGDQKILCGTENDDNESHRKSTCDPVSYFMSDVSQNNKHVQQEDDFKVNLLHPEKNNDEKSSTSSESSSKKSKKSSSSSDTSTEVISVEKIKRKETIPIKSSSSESSSSSNSSSESAKQVKNITKSDSSEDKNKKKKKNKSSSESKSNSSSDKKSSRSSKSSQKNKSVSSSSESSDDHKSKTKRSVSNKKSKLVDLDSSDDNSSVDYETITVGTASAKGKNKGARPNITTSKGVKEEGKIIDVKDLTSATLKKADDYKIDDLRNILRSFSIPTSCFDEITKQRRQYKKDELYNKIKEYLIKKKKSK